MRKMQQTKLLERNCKDGLWKVKKNQETLFFFLSKNYQENIKYNINIVNRYNFFV